MIFSILKSTERKVSLNKYKKDVLHIMAETLNISDSDIAKQDNVWDEWLALEKQECGDLAELLKSKVADAFKARALTILLAPEIRFVPFKWIGRGDSKDYDYLFFSDRIVLADLSPQLQEFVFRLLELNIDTVYGSDDEELLKSAVYYNRFIIAGLEILDENDPRADRLFSRYCINDPVSFWNMDYASGYNPFYAILCAKVPEKWKKIADDKMREIIRAEKAGTAKPRREWEDALSNYAGHIQLGLYSEQFPYGTELLASQMDFIISLPNIEGKEYLGSWKIGQLLGMLKGDEYKDIRHRLARNVVFTNRGEHDGFRVYSEETMTAVLVMFDEFGGVDTELGKKLGEIIDQGKERELKRQSVVSEKKKQTDVVIEKMMQN